MENLERKVGNSELFEMEKLEKLKSPSTGKIACF
jgi:hypothetical protein